MRRTLHRAMLSAVVTWLLVVAYLTTPPFVARMFAAVALVPGQIAFDDSQPYITDGTGVATLAGACTPGNTLLVAATTSGSRTFGATPVSDDGGNTYAPTDGSTTATNTSESTIFWAPCTNAASIITVTLTAGTTDQGITLVAEFSGLNNGDLFEASSVYTDNSSPYDSGNVATTINDSLLFAAIQSTDAANYTNEVGWTDADDWGGGLVGYKILSSTATETWNPTSAAGETSAAVVVAINGSVAGTGWPQGSQQLLIRTGHH